MRHPCHPPSPRGGSGPPPESPAGLPTAGDVPGATGGEDGDMNARALVISFLAALVLFAAGACGGSANAQSSTNASSQRARAVAAWHTLVVCLRQHGYPNVPDPIIDNRGNASIPPSTNPADIPAKHP